MHFTQYGMVSVDVNILFLLAVLLSILLTWLTSTHSASLSQISLFPEKPFQNMQDQLRVSFYTLRQHIPHFTATVYCHVLSQAVTSLNHDVSPEPLTVPYIHVERLNE